MITKNKKVLICVTLLLCLAILSATKLTQISTSPSMKWNKKTIAALNDKRTTVLELTGAAAGISTALTLLPGDAATPVADQLADLSKYFLITLCAIFLEKYLVTMTGYAAFRILIPLACLLYSAYLFFPKQYLKILSAKLFLFAVILVLVIPASVKLSNIIDDTYGSSIEQTIDKAKQSQVEIEQNTSDEEDSDSGLLSGLWSKVKGGVSAVTKNAEELFDDFVEALAVLLVTSCIIPILVLFFFVWIAKMLFHIEIPLSEKNISLASLKTMLEKKEQP